MLASAWEFAKRNKGKIIAGNWIICLKFHLKVFSGGVLVGSAIAYVQSSSRPKTLEKVSTSSELPNQVFFKYIVFF